MIKIADILNATHGGLDIILDCYPQARDCINDKKKHFAIRNERTPSAAIRKYNSETFGEIWQVTDFGGDGRGENGIGVYMNYKGYDRSRYHEALIQLASRYGVKDEIKKELNKPEIRQRPAKAEEKEGERTWQTKDFTEDELKVLGPLVNNTDVDQLNWHSVKYITTTKNGETTVKYSTPNYPIFIRECVISENEKFFKIYEPLNFNKGFRFSYAPKGKKPKNYINGLYELQKAFSKFNADAEAEWNKTNEDKPYKEQKLPAAFICSGERDSLCCHSMGFYPIWFNSETAILEPEEYREIMKYVEVLYNIPDIDETGVRMGKELALKYIDIHTIWLPKWLSTYYDNRGKSRKDLRDWMEIRRKKQDFRNLMKLALPAKFWTSKQNKNGQWSHDIDSVCLFYFLKINGFYALHDENSTTTQYVKVTGNIVDKITIKDVREFVKQWLISRSIDRDIRNLVMNSPKLSNSMMESMDEIDPDFTSYTKRTQLFFFPNKTVEVIADGTMKEYEPGSDDMHNYVWKDNLIMHEFKKGPDFFKITRTKDAAGKNNFDIQILNTNSHFFAYLINTSRLYWRKEMETQFDNEEDRKKYAEAHKFDIAGEGLEEDEIKAQKLNLINKIFTFGYMLHHYKSPSRAWAPFAMDWKIGEDEQCNGRSGKSFFFKVLSFLMKTAKLSGRNPKLMDNPHVFDQVNVHTQMLLLDDCDKYMNTSLFYDNITSDMTVNPKNNQSFNIPFEQSPKIAFTTNYVPAEFDPSSEARLLYMVFGDYYHEKTENNDYIESRSIRDDFGKDLYGQEYTEKEWMDDINFWIQCCKFYLSLTNESIKILPPMGNIVTRKYKADMGTNFEDWAEGYFSENGGNLDKLLQRDMVLDDYMQSAKTNRITMQGFNKKLKAFVNICPWIKELNPKELRNSSGRIQRSITIGNEQKTKDMIYLFTGKEIDPAIKDGGLLDGVPEEELKSNQPF